MSTLVCTFGRVQPPHLGHRRLWREMQDVAEQVNGDALFFVSQTYGGPKNWLPVDLKTTLLRELVEDIEIGPSVRTWPAIFDWALAEGYTKAMILVGEDRRAFTEEFVRRDAEARQRKETRVLPAMVLTIPRLDVSGTKLRQAVLANDFTEFATHYDDAAVAANIWYAVRTEMVHWC